MLSEKAINSILVFLFIMILLLVTPHVFDLENLDFKFIHYLDSLISKAYEVITGFVVEHPIISFILLIVALLII